MPNPYRSIPPLSKQDQERFWSKVQKGKSDECWEWQACRLPSGYGHFHCGSRTDGTRGMFRAHRVARTIAKGPIPAGFCACHRCDNPPCCNPAHLFLERQAGNVRDRDQKGRRPSSRGEQNPRAELVEHDVRIIRARAAEGIPRHILAHENGVTQSTINRIVRRDTWRHVA